MSKEKDVPVRISEGNHRWLANSSDAIGISIKSIIDLAIKSLRGEPESPLTQVFRDKKGKGNGKSK